MLTRKTDRMAIDLVTALKRAHDVKLNANSDADDGRKAQFKEPVFHTWRAVLKHCQRNLRALPAQHDEHGNLIFLIDNAALARLAQVSTRTVIRHRARLKDAGLIAYERYRGSQHPFLMAIAPQYLGLAEVPEAAAIAADIAALERSAIAEEASGDNMSPLPTDDKLKLNNGGVEIGVAVPATSVAGFAQPEDGEDEEGGAQRGRGRDGTTGDTEEGGGDARRTQGEPGGGAIKPPAAGDGPGFMERLKARQVAAHSDKLWRFAVDTLWPGYPVTAVQEAKAMAHIREYYRKAWDMGNLEQWHRTFTAMVSAARRYLDRSPSDSFAAERIRAIGGTAEGTGGRSPKKRWIVSPDMWFDPGFRGGFRGTFKWEMDRQVAARKAAAETALQRAYNAWTANMRRSPSHRRPELELYREITGQLAQLNDDDILRRWSMIVTGIREGVHNGD